MEVLEQSLLLIVVDAVRERLWHLGRLKKSLQEVSLGGHVGQ
jgi:hypothetical protein